MHNNTLGLFYRSFQKGVLFKFNLSVLVIFFSFFYNTDSALCFTLFSSCWWKASLLFYSSAECRISGALWGLMNKLWQHQAILNKREQRTAPQGGFRAWELAGRKLIVKLERHLGKVTQVQQKALVHANYLLQAITSRQSFVWCTVPFLSFCWLLFRRPFPPCVTVVARTCM